MGLTKSDIKIKSFAINPVDNQEWYFDYYGIKKVIDICIKEKLSILGLDGHDIIDESIVPDMNAIFDNSSGVKLNKQEIHQKFFKHINNAEKKIWTIVYTD